MELRRIAQEYLDVGWHPLPLPPLEKAPPPGGTTGYGGVDLTADELDQHKWNGNIGVRMPPYVIGLDIDAYKGGMETLLEMQSRLGVLPDTFVAHSNRSDGSGIRFFVVPQGFDWVTGLSGIDIIQRGHRYAVVWPSIHPEGRPYAWLDQREPDIVQEGVPDPDELPELPLAWFEELSRLKGDTVAARAVPYTAAQAFLDEHVEADAPGYVTDKIVGHFTQHWKAGASRHDTMQHCLTWAMECVRAGISNGRDTVAQLHGLWIEAMVNEPHRQGSEFDAMLRHAIGKAEAHAPEKIARMHDEIAGVRVNATAPPELATVTSIGVYQPEEVSGFFIDWHEFHKRDSSDHSWLIDRFWPWGRSMALWADAKEGKSELALWCACRLAMGLDPWSSSKATPVDVLYLDYEMTPDDLEDRLNDFDIDPRELGHLHYAQFPMIHALDTDAGGREVEAMVEQTGAKAVIIDTLMRTVEGGENDADTINGFARYTGNRLKAMGVAMLRLDHAGKNRENGQRGSSAKRGDVDIIWELRRTERGARLDCTGSSRVGWVDPVLELDRVEVHEVVSYTLPVRLAVTQAEIDKAAELDALGVPATAGRGEAVAALKAAGVPVGKTRTLAGALRIRKEAAERAERLAEADRLSESS